MPDSSRRDVLRYSGIAAVAASGVGSGTASADEGDDGPQASDGVPGSLDLLGHDFLENPSGIYTYGAVRDDGMYAVMGGYYGEGGSFLVDFSDLENPEQVHRVPSANTNRQNDVKFDPCDGLYYRTQEANIDGGEEGFEVIDYGYDVRTVEEPEVVADVDTPRMASTSSTPIPRYRSCTRSI
jgi:hypothetical protein